jgi:hypothetical protein
MSIMNVQSFLAHIGQKKLLPSFSVICFVGAEYPLLFFSHIFSFLGKNDFVVHRLDLMGSDASLLKAQLSMTGFGGAVAYWLNGFHLLAAKKQQEWNAYLQSYDGPHTILYFSNQEETTVTTQVKQSMLTIAVPGEVTPHDGTMVHFLVAGRAHEKTNFATRIASHTSSLSLDSACLFAHYEILLGNSSSANAFFSDWITRIIEPNSSLFVLSQHFFGKKAQLFFKQWSHDAEKYAPSFWVTFWADQMWRAYIYCSLMKQKEYAHAKKAQYKLPFSFINRDWSSYTVTELQKAHHFLSGIDFHLKNGGSSATLELFYGLFFQNRFKK